MEDAHHFSDKNIGTPLDIDVKDHAAHVLGRCLVHTAVFQDVGLVWSNKRRRVGSARQLLPECAGEGVVPEEEEITQLQELGLPVTFGAAKSAGLQGKPQAQVYGAEWHGGVEASQRVLSGEAPSPESQQPRVEWQQAYDAATGHFYYYCEATQATQWEAPAEGYRPALQEWLPRTPAEGQEGGQSGPTPPEGAEARVAGPEPAEQEEAAKRAQQVFDPARSPYHQAVLSFMRHHGWLPDEPEPEDPRRPPQPPAEMAAARGWQRSSAGIRRRKSAAGLGGEGGWWVTDEAPQRMESTGLMPRIPDPAGTHIRFESSDEEEAAIPDAELPPPPPPPLAGGAVGELSPCALVESSMEEEAATPGGAVHALQEEMQLLLVGSPLGEALPGDSPLSSGKRKKKGRKGGASSSVVLVVERPPAARPPDLPKHMQKYWLQRFSLFSRFDEGVTLDEEGWYSATPEVVAWHHAKRVVAAFGPGCVAVDAFAGVGGNAIQLAMTCARVIAVELDPRRMELLRHNAGVYGVEDKIEFVCADFFEVAHTLQADVAFFSPPWGGPRYQASAQFDPEQMGGEGAAFGLTRLLTHAFHDMRCRAAAAWLPRNCSLAALEAALEAVPAALRGPGRGVCEVERAVLNGRLKAVTAYYGVAARDPQTRQHVVPTGEAGADAGCTVESGAAAVAEGAAASD